jgi:hypothetical protein
MAQRAGTTVKALLPVGGRPLIGYVLDALAEVTEAARPIVVGPVGELRGAVGDARLVEEGESGPENVRRGLNALTPEEKSRPVLICTSDLPFITPTAIRWLLDSAPDDAEIVFPVITRESFEAAFPGSPNTYAKLAGQEYTGGSILLVRPEAVERNLPLIEKVFHARKSQIGMARLLGAPFLFRFLLSALTVELAEQRASDLTGCRCRALLDAPPEIGADIDSQADYEWAEAFLRARSPTVTKGAAAA